MNPGIVSALVGAIISAFLYPFVLWLIRLARAKDALRKIFKTTEITRLAPSYVRSGEKSDVRDADYRVASDVRSLTPAEDTEDSVPFSFTHPAFPLVVIGSTRYNELAKIFQQTYSLPFEFVTAHHAANPSARRLTVLTQFGEELVASADTVSHEKGAEEVDYAILLIAMLGDRRKFYWIAGIHSAGTEGAWSYLRKESADIYRNSPKSPGKFIASLIRVRYKIGEDANKPVFDTEALGPTVRSSLHRRSNKETPLAILCDLGNVLMDFDRTRSYRAIAHYAKLSWTDVRDRIEERDVRQRYESGKIKTDAFCDEIYSILGIDESNIERSLIKEFWGDIFWLNRDMAEALKYLKGKGVALVLLSNTNPLHFEGVERDYPDVFDLFSSRVLSYQVGEAKPGASMFQKAIKEVRQEVIDCPTSRMIVVDDTAENIQAAKGFGMRALRYQSYSHFVFWVRNNGLYIP